MSLKITAHPIYELTLPSNGKIIKYRPFLVKEEKVLLIALQEDNEDHIITTLKEVISSCTFNAINVDELPTVDIEYLFIMLRNKSLGEGLDIEVTCTSCGKKNIVTCNLESIKVEGEKLDNVLVLNDDLKVTMRFPTLKMTYGLSTDDIEKTIEIMAKCIEFVEYKGKLHITSELPFSEVLEFVENLTQAQLGKIDQWLDSLPEVVFTDKFICSGCKTENNIRIKGINNFFG